MHRCEQNVERAISNLEVQCVHCLLLCGKGKPEGLVDLRVVVPFHHLRLELLVAKADVHNCVRFPSHEVGTFQVPDNSPDVILHTHIWK